MLRKTVPTLPFPLGQLPFDQSPGWVSPQLAGRRNQAVAKARKTNRWKKGGFAPLGLEQSVKHIRPAQSPLSKPSGQGLLLFYPVEVNCCRCLVPSLVARNVLASLRLQTKGLSDVPRVAQMIQKVNTLQVHRLFAFWVLGQSHAWHGRS